MRATLGLLIFFAGCGTPEPTPCTTSACTDGGVVINELAGTGGDFVELFNASDVEVDLSGFGLTDSDGDGGVRYATSLRFPSGTTIAPRGFFTIALEVDCLPTIAPCLRGEFGLSQGNGDVVTFLDAQNKTLGQQAYPANAAASGSSWARVYDGAPTFEVQRRTPGAANAK